MAVKNTKTTKTAKNPIAKTTSKKPLKTVSPVVKTIATKKVATKKSIDKKTTEKNSVNTVKLVEKKLATQKAAAKKAVAKKLAAKKAAAKKLAAKKAAAKKLAAKKAATKKLAAKKAAAKAKAKTVQKTAKATKPITKKEISELTKSQQVVEETNIVEETVLVKKIAASEIARPISKQVVKKETAESQQPRIRYSDTDLVNFEQRILARLAKEKENYELLKSTISHGGSNDTEDTSPSFKVLEDGSAISSREESGQQLERIKKFIDNLEKALMRVRNKTYGICRETGKLIPKERLYANLITTQSIEAKTKR